MQLSVFSLAVLALIHLIYFTPENVASTPLIGISTCVVRTSLGLQTCP